MATRTAGAKIVLDGENEYKQALTNLNAGNRVLASEMKKLQAEYKGNADSVEFLTKKGDLLNRQLLDQKEKIDVMRQALEAAAKKYGEGSEEAMKWQKELNNAEAAQYDLEHAIEENSQAIENQGSAWDKVGGLMDDIAGKMGIRIPNEAKKALSGMQGLSAGTVAAMTAAATAIAALVKAVTELHEMTVQTAADMDELVSNSMKTGISTRTLQELKYAENLIDVSVDTISGSLTKLTANMAKANDGSEEMAQKFADLGVSIEDSATGGLRTAEDVFYDLIDALGSIPGQTERDAAAMELLGKSAQELNPLILQGSKALKEYAAEAEAAGYVLDESQIKKLAEVDDSYQRVQLTMEALRKQISADFAPASKEAMDLFADGVKKAGDTLERTELIENFATLVTTTIDLTRELTKLVESIPGWKNPIQQLSDTFKGLALVMATIADAVNLIEGLKPWNWNSGMATTALGWNRNKGQMSHTQQVLYGNAEGWVQDPETGLYVGNYGHNAGGTDNWRGGLTELGEAGPETAILPEGTRILTAQETEDLGGDTYYITIDAKNVKEFNDIVRIAKSSRVKKRMKGK